MERELGVSISDNCIANDSVCHNDANGPHNHAGSGTNIKAVEADLNLTSSCKTQSLQFDSSSDIVDHNSINLSLSDSPPPSPRTAKRQEVPELSPHLSDDNEDTLISNTRFQYSMYA